MSDKTHTITFEAPKELGNKKHAIAFYNWVDTHYKYVANNNFISISGGMYATGYTLDQLYDEFKTDYERHQILTNGERSSDNLIKIAFTTGEFIALVSLAIIGAFSIGIFIAFLIHL